MHFEVHHPQGWLASFVDHYWRVGVSASEYPFNREVLLPDGGVTVLFNLGDVQNLIEENGSVEDYERSWVSGERSRAITLGSPGNTRVITAARVLPRIYFGGSSSSAINANWCPSAPPRWRTAQRSER